MCEIWSGRRARQVKYENINNSDLEGMSLASFCQSRADYPSTKIIVNGDPYDYFIHS